MISKYIGEGDIVESVSPPWDPNYKMTVSKILMEILKSPKIEKSKKIEWLNCFFKILDKAKYKLQNLDVVKAVDFCQQEKYSDLEKRLQDYMSNVN